MFTRFNNLLARRTGAVLVVAVLAAAMMIGMTAMVTDTGWMYYQQSRLQTAVNAGWKAGYYRMAELGYPLDNAKKADITARVTEVMKANGYTDAQLASISVTFPDDRTLNVQDQQEVGLFFARYFDITTADIGASRVASQGAAVFVPIAIPYGETRDIDKNNYSVTLFATDTTPLQGFTASEEYILKLGGSENPDPPNMISRIIVYMDNQPSSTAYQKAYGVVHWALGIENFVPVEWLIGYRGGAFMFRYYTDPALEAAKKYSVLKKRLSDRGIAFTELTAQQANAIYTAVDAYVPAGKTTNIIKMSYQPVIKMVSSSDPDPVGKIMRTAEIPYGGTGSGAGFVPYKMGLNDTYNTAKVNVLWDSHVLAGELMHGAHWVHIHHEKFGDTGGNEGKIDAALVTQYGYKDVKSGSITFPAAVVGKQEMVYKIREFAASGKMLYSQCAATDNMDAALWMRRLRINAADPNPYADCFAYTGFNNVTFSKGKQVTGWPVSIARTSFEATTKKDGTGNFNLTDQYDPMQQNHKMNGLSSFSGNTSSFNKTYLRIDANANANAALTKNPETLGPNPVTVMATNGDGSARYIRGRIGSGEFTFLGGHEASEIYSKRLTLNNVLLGSLIAEKIAIGDGSKKYNFGIVDPTNTANIDPNDLTSLHEQFGNNFGTGQNAPTNVNDRILPIPGVASLSTDLALALRLYGNGSIPPYTKIIVPITDIPQSVKDAGLYNNATATSIYDLRGIDDPNGAVASSAYDFKASARIIGYAEFEILPTLIDPADAARNARATEIGGSQEGQIRGRFIRYIVQPYTTVLPD